MSRKIMCLSIFCLFLFSCTMAVNDETTPGGETSTSTSHHFSSDPVYKVNFNNYNVINIDISGDIIGKTLYLVKANSSSLAVAAGDSGQALSSEVDRSAPLESNPESGVFFNVNDQSVERRDYAPLREFEQNLPALTEGSFEVEQSRASFNSQVVHYGEIGLAEGEKKSFWVENSNGDWVAMAATLRAVGRYCYIWVADVNYDNSSSTSNDNKINDVAIDLMVTKFDGTAANNYEDGIYKLTTNIFGYEFGGGPLGNGGRDSDQHISIFIYDIDGDYYSAQSGGVFGYFWSKDWYEQSSLDSYGIKTNYSEIFYLDAHFTDKYFDIMMSTLGHEYQHMIHFNEKYVQRGEQSESWFNEMCSMVAEDLLRTHLGISISDSPQSRLSTFNYTYYQSGVRDWLSGINVLKSYASAYTFGAFLARNYGGAELFRSLMLVNSTNMIAITDALALGGYSGETFLTVFEDYGAALVFSTELAPYVKGFRADSSTVNGITYELNSFTVNPFKFDPAYQMSLRPYGFSIHTKNSWSNLSGPITVSLSNPEAGVNFYLIVK